MIIFFEIKGPGFKSWVCHTLNMWSWTRNSSPCASVSTHGKWGIWTLSLLSQLWLRWRIIADGFPKGKVPQKHIAFRLHFIVFSYKVTVFSDINNTNDNIPLITPSYPQYPNQGLGLDWMVPKGRLCSLLHLKPWEQCLVHKSSSVFMSLSVKVYEKGEQI